MKQLQVFTIIPVILVLGPFSGFTTVESWTISQFVFTPHHQLLHGQTSWSSGLAGSSRAVWSGRPAWSPHISYYEYGSNSQVPRLSHQYGQSNQFYSPFSTTSYTSFLQPPYYRVAQTGGRELPPSQTVFNTTAPSSVSPRTSFSSGRSLNTFNLIIPMLAVSSRNKLRKPKQQIQNTFAYKYLEHFGYMEMTRTNGGNHFKPAITKYQEMYHLKRTGKIDRETMEDMMKPRCDNSDTGMDLPMPDSDLALRRWPKRYLTYRINSLPSNSLGRNHEYIKSEITRAFKVWANVSDFMFEEIFTTRSTVDIDIDFKNKSHDDGHDFDFETLAHAFYPNLTTAPPPLWGDIHFSNAYNWLAQIPPASPTLHDDMSLRTIFPVALHEIGHSLGLGHSTEPDSVMVAKLPAFPRFSHPSLLDIQNLKQLYPPITPKNAVSRRRPSQRPSRHRYYQSRHNNPQSNPHPPPWQK